MNKMGRTAALTVGALVIVGQCFAQSEKDMGEGRAVVTLFTKHSEVEPNVAQADVSAKVSGKDAAITGWAPFKGADDALELVVLIDDGARNLGRQFDEIKQFVQNLGPHSKIAIAYMENGRAVLAGPLTTDHQQALSQLRLPAGPISNPYFSLSDLAQRWPSRDGAARREVLLLSDGVDPNNRRFDPDDLYVQTAINDSVRAGLVVYSIYWRSRFDESEPSGAVNGGQSLLNEIADATGGNNYWMGNENPVSFQPFFQDLMRRFANQYQLKFAARLDRKPTIQTLKLKVEGLSLQVIAPQQVFVTP